MVFVYHLGLLWFPQVKCVAMRILVADNEIHWLLWIPAKGCRLVFEVYLVDWSVASNIVQTDASISRHTSQQVHFTGIEFDLGHCVNTPFKRLQRR